MNKKQLLKTLDSQLSDNHFNALREWCNRHKFCSFVYRETTHRGEYGFKIVAKAFMGNATEAFVPKKSGVR